MTTSELFLLALGIIFSVPYLLWRLGRTDYIAPLVVVQIITGLLLGPGVLGAALPSYYSFVFTEPVVQALHGIALWAVMLFVWIAGIELDITRTWSHRRESAITAALALGMPLAFGASVALALTTASGWIGTAGRPWQFVLGVGMACAVTALPILILFLERLEILRQPLGQRILRYASLDDLAIWGVLAVILMDWTRIGRQILFLITFGLVAVVFRALMRGLAPSDRWYAGLIWLIVCGFAADWSGLHYMVGAFLAGAVVDGDWFDRHQMDQLREHVLLIAMPVFFLSTGLRTSWSVGGAAVFLAAGSLLAAQVAGKLAGLKVAGWVLGWRAGEASMIGWLLQTKALIEIIFASILLDRAIISSDTFTALLLMAVLSTMLTIPIVTPRLARLQQDVIARSA